MGIEIRFEVDDEQYERLKAIKDARGYTWKGLMLEGVRALDTDET
ncbi:hypothetical protein J2752_002268 [Halarchaeum rubridurum]|uniref:Ribbon-helix-helix protein, copG family n=1 Tax=Halarchaeum rubridurum TaxID=489911 RepID=A0A830G2R3_9EURY|nr:hypothetical protein [Halarchaeum rubridurum]MBP1955345.1 hypothetical protein [Halarchaeum rubridurum]GGM71656.1 hypothetical protein GCM10009017_22000 [Halarchaeum rubridurum]